MQQPVRASAPAASDCWAESPVRSPWPASPASPRRRPAASATSSAASRSTRRSRCSSSQPQAAAENFYKLVESAVANAETTEGLSRESLVISRVQIDEGPTMKRWRPRAKGAANRILKRSSHLTVVVTPADAYPTSTTSKKGRNR